MDRQHDLAGPEETDHRSTQHGVVDQEWAEIDRVLPAMRGLRSRARVTNLSRAAQLERFLDFAAAGRLDEAGRAQAAAVAHQLIGSAGTFGFADASRRAVELKDVFALTRISADDLTAARDRLAALRVDLQNGDDDLDV